MSFLLAVSCGGRNGDGQGSETQAEPGPVSETTSTEMVQLRDSLAADGTRISFYEPQDVCSSLIEVHTLDGVITKVEFTDGCPGNTMGVSRLVEGMTIDEAISRLEGIPCGGKPTSCPDQLSKALRAIRSR